MILFSHGLGVEKTGRGLFTDISKALDVPCVMFDYNRIDVKNKSITISTIDKQVEQLTRQIKKIKGPVDLVCHSQGCSIAALIENLPKNVTSVLFLAPISTMTSQNIMDMFKNRDDTIISRTGSSVLSRQDGSKTIVPPTYWTSLDAVGDVDELYAKLAQKVPLTIIIAGNDELLGNTIYSRTEEFAEIHTMKGADHNFSGLSRKKLLKIFTQLGSILKK